MSKLIATLVAGFISVGAFAATATTTPVGTTPTDAKVAAEPAKEAKKTVAKVEHKSAAKAVTPEAKTPAAVK